MIIIPRRNCNHDGDTGKRVTKLEPPPETKPPRQRNNFDPAKVRKLAP